MTGPAAAEQEPTNIPAPIDELIMRVGNLEPAQVVPEVESIVNGRSRLLANVVRIPDASVGVDVIEAIHGALLTSNNRLVSGDLAFSAVITTSNGIGERKDREGSAELAVRAAALANVIKYPADRAEALIGLAGSMIVASTGTGALAPQAQDVIEQAADGLVDYIGNVRRRRVYPTSHELSRLYLVGESAAENAAEIIKTGAKAKTDTPIRIYRQTAQIIDAGMSSKSGVALEKTSLIGSIIRSAGTVSSIAGSDTALEKTLVDMSGSQVEQVLATYSGELRGSHAYITLDMKCDDLTILGSKMVDAMESYTQTDSSAQMQRLSKQAVAVFEAAGGYAERFDKSRNFGRRNLSKGKAAVGSTFRITEAASRAIDVDFDSSKQMYEIAFNMGQIEYAADDRLPSYRYQEAFAVLKSIGHRAKHAKDPKTAFELFGLAHELIESSDFDEDDKQRHMSSNVSNLVSYTSSSAARYSPPSVMLDQVSESLADFIAKPETIEGLNTTASNLQTLNSHVKSSKLRQVIDNKVRALYIEETEKAKEARKPKNETERLAQEFLESI